MSQPVSEKKNTHSEQAEKARKVVEAKRKTEQKASRDAAKREALSSDEGLTITLDGITVTLTDELFDDYDAFAALNEGNPFPFIAAMWPDKTERDEALNVLRSENGKLSLKRVITWVGDLFEKVGQGNS